MKLKSGIFKHIGIIAVVLFLVSCKGDDDAGGGSDSFDRKAMLANLADNVILPAYDSLTVATNQLHESTEFLIQSTTAENIEQVRTVWKTTLTQWQYAGVYDLGPASDNGLVSFFNLYPVSTIHIEENIASGNYNLESAANINAVGLEAIDYLLFGLETDAEMLATFFTENPDHLTYLIDNTNLLKTKAQTTLSAWQDGYATTFKNASGTDIGSALGQLVNSSIQYLEIHIRDAKIGIPSGARSSSGLPLPLQVEGYYNGSVSKEMLIKGMDGWKNMFNGNSRNGDQGTGLDDYLKFLGTSFDGNPLHEEINGRLTMAANQTEELATDLKTAVVNQQEECLSIFDELQRTIVLLKVDMTSAMGIQITYVDNDGD
ncbi:imelysin family protein [Cryomorpha ignava]|uniref:Imelysin family protein n=1 Tax=Cryomorpha ignava TaxID=101383 RepID=A0A7K3WS26_9FLAO|nr:imelysin family protein [Cryomorpha ignava]NEN24318.1 imelysin family protein [Cryomorpha ignava]